MLPDGSRSLIPAEWTDLQRCAETRNVNIASVADLLRSRTVVDALQRRLAANEGEAGNHNLENARASEALLYGRPSGSADIDLRSTRRGTEKRRH